MRGFSIASVALMVAACSGDDDPAPAPSTPTGATDAGTEAAPPADDAGGDTGAPEPDAGSEGGAGGGPTAAPAEVGDPVVVARAEAATLVGITTDDQAVYRNRSALMVVPLEPGAEPSQIATDQTLVAVKGDLVAMWTNVDYSANFGELSIWTAEHGLQEIGPSLLSSELLAVSADGEKLLYAQNFSATTYDLVVNHPDLAAPETVLTGIGRATMETCQARYEFAGDVILVAWCAPGTTGATLARLEPPAASGGAWQATTIAEGVNPTWSADEAVSRIFYTTNRSQAFYYEDGQAFPIENQVGWGMLLPDGSEVIYTVNDQLRRSALPDVHPKPVVTRNFRRQVGFTPDLKHVLYSTTMSYEEGVQQDLLLAPADEAVAEPNVLVAQPQARLLRSVFSADGQWLIYATAMSATGGGELTFAPVTAPEHPTTFEGAHDALAARDSIVLFTNNRSPEGQHPVTADLQVVALGSEQDPVQVAEGIVDVSGFFLTPDKESVVYVLANLDEEGAPDPDGRSIVVRPIR